METMDKVKLKLNDVYRFRWSPEYRKSNFAPEHCFDGQLIVRESEINGLYLMDTYWASKYDGFKHWSDYKWFTLDKALENGELQFICNLDEVEEVTENDTKYFSESDIFDLSYQHNCYKFLVKKKGAKRCPDKMRKVIESKIKDAERQIASAKREIESQIKNLEQLDNGNLDIYI